MKARVRFASIPEVDCREMTVAVSGEKCISMRQVIGEISDSTGLDFRTKHGNYTFLLNGRYVDTENADSVMICDGDSISVLPYITGG